MNITKYWNTFQQVRALPKVTIHLMKLETQGNDPFFAKLTEDFYRECVSRHPKFPLIRRSQYGVALCELPKEPDGYFNKIESSARRNHRKAVREGCTFRRINFNDHLEDIRGIWMSTDTRQGKLMPEEFLQGAVNRINDPVSLTNMHDYPYYGVFFNDRLVGYMGCLVSGEYGGIQQIYGHAGHLQLGIVPQLVIGFADAINKNFPHVRYMSYGNFFGAGETMQRFKKKFLLFPHNVEWKI